MKRQLNLKDFFGEENGNKKLKIREPLVECPICLKSVLLSKINLHLDASCSTDALSPEEVQEIEEWQKANPSKKLAHPEIKYTKMPISGLMLIEDFVTEAEEKVLLDVFESGEWKLDSFNGPKFAQGFGATIDYKNRLVLMNDNDRKPIPQELETLFQKMRDMVAILNDYFPNQVGVISYHRNQGHGIKAHVDDRMFSGPFIANLSLAGHTYMTFTPVQAKAHHMLPHQLMGEDPLQNKISLGNPEGTSTSLTHNADSSVIQEGANSPTPNQNGNSSSPSGENGAYEKVIFHEKGGRVDVLLPRRSLQIMTGESRYSWMHAILNENLLTDRRISVTMRQLSFGLK